MSAHSKPLISPSRRTGRLRAALALLAPIALVAMRAPADRATWDLAGARGQSAEEAPEGSADRADSAMHADFGELLARYVTPGGLVRYHAWSRTPEDVARLSEYVDRLESTRPTELEPAARLAFWIDLYNAATLELVLAHYPLSSIREIGGDDLSPWSLEVVSVEGRHLTLDEIENGIIRERFADPRIHFALSCASLGCPPLAREPYVAARLDRQLDRATRAALGDPRWLSPGPGVLRLSPIFSWYESDFAAHSGSLVSFLSRYVAIPTADDGGEPALVFTEYDWSLNAADRSPATPVTDRPLPGDGSPIDGGS